MYRKRFPSLEGLGVGSLCAPTGYQLREYVLLGAEHPTQRLCLSPRHESFLDFLLFYLIFHGFYPISALPATRQRRMVGAFVRGFDFLYFRTCRFPFFTLILAIKRAFCLCSE